MAALPTDFDEFFDLATGLSEPHNFQRRIAYGAALPQIVEVPPGLGKTAAIVVAWLWRLLASPDETVRTETPRRLVFCLPQRSLVDQTAEVIASWLSKLGLSKSVEMYVLMGGTPRNVANTWRGRPDRFTILVGTVDMLVSKAMMRAYGTARHAFPMDAALIWNDCHVVIDEIQAAPASTRTLRQIDAFRRTSARGVFGPAGLTCMSATVPRGIVDTVDNPFPPSEHVVTLMPEDDDEDIRRRRSARRLITRLDVKPSDHQAVARRIGQAHQAGTLTLAIVNTVQAARELHRALGKQKLDADLLLLHSRFRPFDRRRTMETLTSELPPEGMVVVATQVIEAGIDIDARLLVTEVAPWPALIQRIGRCNRAGGRNDAEVHWYEAKQPAPYEAADTVASAAQLEAMETTSVTSQDLLDRHVATVVPSSLTLRRADFEALFDTSPDLSGNDLDIAPYIRDTDDLDVQLCWMRWPGAAPDPNLRPLAQDWRCRASLSEARVLNQRVPLWRFDPVAGRWRTVDRANPLRPGEILLIAADAGGYTPTVGLDVGSAAAVSVEAEDVAPATPGSFETGNAGDDQSMDAATWIPLDQHLDESATEARAIVDSVGLPTELADDVVLAARLHDAGKAHPIWQDALCATASGDEKPEIDGGRPWAKSPHSNARLRYPDGISTFRHELASMLLLQGSLVALIEKAHDPDLVRYLILAHHGKLRVQVRELGTMSSDELMGLKDGVPVQLPSVLGTVAASVPISIRQFALSGDPERGRPAWVDVVTDLISRYGIFRLAYLETLVRVADWRASALHSHEPDR